MSAALLQAQLPRDKRSWAMGAYALAVSTGLLRLYKNKHWLSDVVLGAFIGAVSVAISKKIIERVMILKNENVKRSTTHE